MVGITLYTVVYDGKGDLVCGIVHEGCFSLYYMAVLYSFLKFIYST